MRKAAALLRYTPPVHLCCAIPALLCCTPRVHLCRAIPAFLCCTPRAVYLLTRHKFPCTSSGCTCATPRAVCPVLRAPCRVPRAARAVLRIRATVANGSRKSPSWPANVTDDGYGKNPSSVTDARADGGARGTVLCAKRLPADGTGNSGRPLANQRNAQGSRPSLDSDSSESRSTPRSTATSAKRISSCFCASENRLAFDSDGPQPPHPPYVLAPALLFGGRARHFGWFFRFCIGDG